MPSPAERVRMRVLPRGLLTLLPLLALCLLTLAACAGVPGNQGNPSEPILVAGRVVDDGGAPIRGAGLQLSVLDHSRAIIGQPVPTIFRASFTTGLDGAFAIHLAPTPELRAFGAANAGFVNFDLIALAPDSSVVFPFAFPRELAGNGWAGEAPSVVISPSGVTEPGADPGVEAPLPVRT
jgi:hypothetical protein